MRLNRIQEEIGKEMEIDAKYVKDQIVQYLRNYFAAAGQKKAIIGFSGGIDSTVIGYLMAEAIGSENIIAAHLPFGDVGTGSNFADVTATYNILNIPSANRKWINIAGIVASFAREDANMTPLRLGNLKARIRMIELYDLAAKYNGLVVGTSNKSEILIGYFTKFGDGGVDLEPIGDLFKTQVYQLARYLKIPESIIEKPPSANLWPGQTDEKEIGYPYKVLDRILYLMYIKKVSDIKLVNFYGYIQKDIDEIRRKVTSTEHKRKLPPIYEIVI